MSDPNDASEIIMAVCDLVGRTGLPSLKGYEGIWEHQIDACWRVAINPHGATLKSSTGLDVPPWGFCFEFNGWPAGVLTPGGGILAAGAAANRDTLLAAIRGAVQG